MTITELISLGENASALQHSLFCKLVPKSFQLIYLFFVKKKN